MTRLDKPSGSVLLVGGECGAGSPARRRGNFLLRGQKKVTKEEALNRTRPRRRQERRAKTTVGTGSTKRTAALSRLTCHESAPSHQRPVRRAAARRAHQNSQTPMQRRSGGASAVQSVGWGELCEPQQARHRTTLGFAALTPTYLQLPSKASPQRRGIPDEPGVQPALSGVKGRWMALVTGTAARAKRVASARSDRASFRAPLAASRLSCAVQGLFFGDFLLAPQKKVTAPPGAHPGTALANNLK